LHQPAEWLIAVRLEVAADLEPAGAGAAEVPRLIDLKTAKALGLTVPTAIG